MAIRKVPELDMTIFVYFFPSCAQDSVAMLAIMDVFSKLKVAISLLKTLYYSQDNAGCYHSRLTIVGAKVVADRNKIVLEGLDFSDPQGGKGPCDRKSANIKNHINEYLNSGHDFDTAQHMKTAIQSSGSIPGVWVSLYDPPASITAAVKWSSVSLVNNVRYEVEGMRFWGENSLLRSGFTSCEKLQFITIFKKSCWL